MSHSCVATVTDEAFPTREGYEAPLIRFTFVQHLPHKGEGLIVILSGRNVVRRLKVKRRISCPEPLASLGVGKREFLF